MVFSAKGFRSQSAPT